MKTKVPHTSSDLLQRTDDLLHGLAKPTARERAAALVEWMALQEIEAFNLDLARSTYAILDTQRYAVSAGRKCAPQIKRGIGHGSSVAAALLDYHRRNNDPDLDPTELQKLFEQLIQSEEESET